MNAELMRLLENILRLGVVEQISADKKAVRVRSGRLLTTWIRSFSCMRRSTSASSAMF